MNNKFIAIVFFIFIMTLKVLSNDKIVNDAYLYGILRYNLPYNNIDEVFLQSIENKEFLDFFLTKHQTKQIVDKKKATKSIQCVNEKQRVENLTEITEELRFKLLNISKINNFNIKNILKNSSEDYRLGLIKLWCYIDYLYPFSCKIDNFETTLIEAEKILNQTEDKKSNYLKAIKHIAFKINDRHTLIEQFDENGNKIINPKYLQQTYLPFIIEIINNEVYINRSIKDSTLNNKKIISINNQDPFKYIDTIKYNRSSINNEDFIINTKELNSTVLIDNDTLIISSIKISDFTFFLNNKRENFNLKHTYLDLFSAKKIPEKYFLADTLIIDMRGYPNNAHINKNIFYFFEETNLGSIKLDKNIPGSFKTKSSLKKGKLKNSNQIVYALVNSYTGSYSEILCLLIKSNPKVKFVGIETSNAFGIYDFKLRLSLPGNIKFNTTKEGVLYNDLMPYSIKGINPEFNINILQKK